MVILHNYYPSLSWTKMSRPHNHNNYNSSDESEYDGSNSDSNVKQKAKLLACLPILIIVGSVTLIIRLAHPSKPKFLLQDATVFNFNLSPAPPHFLNSSLQITVASRNPSHYGIYYTDVRIYAQYKNQQITYETTIPDLYQLPKETNVWSLFINGDNIPIAPPNVHVLSTDQSNGTINIIIKLEGQVKWNMFGTRKFNFHVRCNAIMYFGSNAVISNDGVDSVLSSVKYLLDQWCRVAI